MHKEFGQALRDAVKKGVKVLAMDCIVTNNSIKVDKSIDILL
jgi:sugar fermentation stimulation protein A